MSGYEYDIPNPPMSLPRSNNSILPMDDWEYLFKFGRYFGAEDFVERYFHNLTGS